MHQKETRRLVRFQGNLILDQRNFQLLVRFHQGELDQA